MLLHRIRFLGSTEHWPAIVCATRVTSLVKRIKFYSSVTLRRRTKNKKNFDLMYSKREVVAAVWSIWWDPSTPYGQVETDTNIFHLMQFDWVWWSTSNEECEVHCCTFPILFLAQRTVIG